MDAERWVMSDELTPQFEPFAYYPLAVAADHSALMPISSPRLRARAMYSRTMVSNYTGPLDTGSAPSVSRRSRSSGSARMRAISFDTRSRIASGVPAGASTPNQSSPS